MASLKEIKGRIASVENTRKITSARQKISSAYLHRAQQQLEHIRLYKKEIDDLIATFFQLETDPDRIDNDRAQGSETAIIILSSNSGMCGSFNNNMLKQLQELPKRYCDEHLIYFPIGSKIREALHKLEYPTDKYGIQVPDSLSGKFDMEEARQIINRFINLYQSGQVKKIDIYYYYYQTASRHEITVQPLLPYPLSLKNESGDDTYIIEPGKKELAEELIALSIHANFYHTLISNQASEHAARLIAMQLATENADELQEELKITYNKLRQQSITSELLDIISSTFA